jgi:hypothetical protein
VSGEDEASERSFILLSVALFFILLIVLIFSIKFFRK